MVKEGEKDKTYLFWFGVNIDESIFWQLEDCSLSYYLLCGRKQSTGATNHWEKTMQSAWCELQSLIPAGISSTLESCLCSHKG